jgi:hypothetical protein
MKRLDLLAAAVLAVGGIGLAASPGFAQATGQPAAQQPAAAQPSGAAAQPAAQPADQSTAAQPAGAQQGAAQQASESDVRQVLSQVAQAAVTKGGAQTLTQQIAQADQDRIKDFSKDTTQLDQSIDQLRQAYKDKYQQDLDLSKSSEVVFTAQFFHIGGAGDAARQASARIGSDAQAAGGAARDASAANATAQQQSDAAKTAGAAGTDAAQAASSAISGAPMVTIPASHDLPETSLKLVNEGGSWKIDLPEGVDGQKLSQSLQQQISSCTAMKDKWPADANEASRAISHSVFVAVGIPSSTAAGATGAGATGTPSTPSDSSATPQPGANR